MVTWPPAGLVTRFGAGVASLISWAGIAFVAFVAFFLLKWSYDAGVIDDWLGDSNEAFEEQFNENTEEANTNSDDRQAAHADKVRTTEELIDDALEDGCAVVEYLASGGTDCVQPETGTDIR